MPERVLQLAEEISTLLSGRITAIQQVSLKSKMLALNASIEAARAGTAGAGFAVVANEVKSVSDQVNSIINQLNQELNPKLDELNRLGSGLIARLRGSRLADLSLNMIEIIDRNLYERSCDVRWWATDSAVVECATAKNAGKIDYCSKRLGVILEAYTVYLDLWVVDLNGKVLSNGRPEKFRQARSQNVAQASWFKQALATKDGTEFAVADIGIEKGLDGRMVATYAAAIREGGASSGAVIGVLGIFFDWQAQSETVVRGVRLTPEEKSHTRCLILDNAMKVIASSNGAGVLNERYSLKTEGQPMGSYAENDAVIGFALTPGYETYKGLGWYGVVEQRIPKRK